MYPQLSRASRQFPTLPDRLTGDAHRGQIDRLPHLNDLVDREPESQPKRLRQRLNDVLEFVPPAKILPFPPASICEVVFGLSGDEMQRLLAADEEEDRAIFEQMFEASFLRGTPDASEDD